MQNSSLLPRNADLGHYSKHLHNVLYLQGDRNYTFLVLKNGQRVLFAQTMCQILAQLPEGAFVRVSKGQAVNTAYIQSVCFSCSYSYLNTHTGESFVISRRRATLLRQDPAFSLTKSSFERNTLLTKSSFERKTSFPTV